MQQSTTDEALQAFLSVRPRLFGIAYRMLGTSADAEEVVQEVWLRWQNTDRSVVRDSAAFLSTTATRLAINSAQSAHARRETYVGTWLPEPVDTSDDPLLGAERAHAIELAVLLLLEALSPRERAAYVLREAFDYSYKEIAVVLELSEANARQIVTRAREHITAAPRTPVEPAEHRRLLAAFIDAAQKGEMAELERLLAADAVSYSDGNGVVRAARVPVRGRDRVVRFISAFASHFWNGVTITEIVANGVPSVVLTRDEVVIAVATIRASAEGIDQIMWQMNPDKLIAFQRRNSTSPMR